MRDDKPQTPILETGTRNFSPVIYSKRRISRRILWTVVLVPLAFIVITTSAQYLIRPSPIDLLVLTSDNLSWHEISSKAQLWQPHERDEQERRQVSASSAVVSSSTVIPSISSIASSMTSTTSTSTSPSVSSTPDVNAPVPTIPSSPPVLPTPFPQPFDPDLTKNFSSTSCFNFFSNMTAALSFRSCRSLSFLIDSSTAFFTAQTNLTLMNSIIWGTCNTETAEDQCIANMGGFADALDAACVQDLQDQNQMAVSAQRDLRAYALMRQIGCLTDPTSNTYCYLDAVRNSNPSDLYFYYLPLGISLPNGTVPSCSSCTRTLMTMYSSALANSTEAAALTGLKQTYAGAAKLAVAKCGTGYANTIIANTVPAALLPGRSWWTGLAVLLGVMLQVLS